MEIDIHQPKLLPKISQSGLWSKKYVTSSSEEDVISNLYPHL